VNDKLSVLLIALLGGAVGVLGVGALSDAGADTPVASQQLPVVVNVESPSAVAGGNTDTGATVKVADVDGLCSLGAKDPGHRGGTGVAASVNSSGNSANTNTNAIALNNQVGLEQRTIVVQYAQNQADANAAQEQGQDQGNAQAQDQSHAQDQGQAQAQGNEQGQGQGQEADAEQGQGQGQGEAQGQAQVAEEPPSTTTTT
jgi:hypothetical protein